MITKKVTIAAAAVTFGLVAGPALAAYSDRHVSTSADSTAISGGANPDFVAASVDNLKGMTVQDKSGRDLGTVRDVMFDPSNGKIDRLILSSGEVAGGEKIYAVPFDSVRIDRGHNLLTVNMNEDQLGRSDNQYYGVGPSYDRTTKSDLSSSSKKGYRSDTATAEPRPLVAFTADELRGMHVIDARGNDLGIVRDVTVDNGKIDRLIVGAAPIAADKVFAIPVDRLQYQPDGKILAANMTRDQLVTSEYYGVAPRDRVDAATLDRRSLAAYTADELKGRHVVDAMGSDIGVVRDVTLDSANGKIDHLIVTPPLVSGMPQHVFTIPIDRVQVQPDSNVLAVNMTRDRLYTSEYYGVAPENSISSDNTYGATQWNRTGQPPQRWELGSSPEGRNY